MNPAAKAFETVGREATIAGFNLVGAAAVDLFDSRAPAGHRVRDQLPDSAYKSIIVVGSGGPSFWSIFKGRAGHASPDEIEAAGGSINAYSRVVFGRLANEMRSSGVAAEVLFPFEGAGRQLSFRRLAESAGFGTADTVLTILLHPEYGPWVSVRGAIAVDAELAPTGPIARFDPCEGCHRPCAAACPIGSFDGPTWDYEASLRYRVMEDGCPTACLSRRACVIGREHQYSVEEYSYRHAFFPETLKMLRQKFIENLN
jgi:hypothetical protein